MKKLLTLAVLLVSFSMAWANYAPTADEVIILNQVYSASATTTGYSTHDAIAWGGTASTNSKKAGDPNNNGEATSSNVGCYSIKANSGGKNITVSIEGCSQIIIYHEKHASRYVSLKSDSKTGAEIGKGSANTYYTEVDLDADTEYSIFLHGTDGSADQDFYVYAVKLIKGESTPAVTYTATYKANNGTAEDDIVDAAAKKVAACTFTAPEGETFAGWNTAADGTGTAYEVGTALESDVTLYAQWETITTCTNLIPASSGSNPAIGDEIILDALSEGGKIFVADMKADNDIQYNELGLLVGGGGKDSLRIELNNYLQEGSVITLNLVAAGTTTRGLNIQTLGKSTVYQATWTPSANFEEKSIEYTVPAGSPLIGTNKFLLQRNNSVYLKSLTVANCGAPVPDEVPSGINDAAADANATKPIKRLVNGVLLIEKDGVTYSAQGGILK